MYNCDLFTSQKMLHVLHVYLSRKRLPTWNYIASKVHLKSRLESVQWHYKIRSLQFLRNRWWGRQVPNFGFGISRHCWWVRNHFSDVMSSSLFSKCLQCELFFPFTLPNSKTHTRASFNSNIYLYNNFNMSISNVLYFLFPLSLASNLTQCYLCIGHYKHCFLVLPNVLLFYKRPCRIYLNMMCVIICIWIIISKPYSCLSCWSIVHR